MDNLALNIQTYIENGQYFSLFALVFAFGLGSAFTPCVYPLIPVTLATVGITSQTNIKRSFLLSLSYAGGIILTFTVLGLICSKTGAAFGFWLENPTLLLVIGLVLFWLALACLDITQLPFLAFLQRQAGKLSGRGFLGAFLTGGVSGLLAAPCLVPFLATLLLFAASAESTYLGTMLLFTYAVGFGLVFLTLGTFSFLLKYLPKSGNWLNLVKGLFAIAIFWFLLYLTNSLRDVPLLMPDSFLKFILFGILIFFMLIIILLGFVRDSSIYKAGGSILAAFFIFQISTAPEAAPVAEAYSAATLLKYQQGQEPLELKWFPSYTSVQQIALENNLSVMVYFTAKWCATCHLYTSRTFTDPQVKFRLQKFLLVKLDLGRLSAEDGNFMQRWGVVGSPTIIFLDPRGNECPGSRIEGYLEPKAFLEHLREAFWPKNTISL